jgi:WD40 repeat protein
MVSRLWTMATHMTQVAYLAGIVLFSFIIGLAAVSPSQEHAILAFPGRQQGHIQVVDLNKINSTTSVLSPTSPNNAAKTMQSTTTNVSIIAAHSGQLSCLAMNFDGTKCATASEKGTLIRIFDTATGQLLNELRRGMDRAEIYSIAFNKESTRICVSSDKGTIHIFNLDASVVASAERTPRGPTYGEVTPSHSSTLPGFTHSGNRGSSFRFMKDLLPKYFSSEWSFAHATIPSETRCVVGFGEQTNSIIGKGWSLFLMNAQNI